MTTNTTTNQHVQMQKPIPQIQINSQNNNNDDDLTNIKVRASDGVYLDSEWSETLDHVVTQTLDVPKNLKIVDGVAMWDEVADAKGYVVKINELEYETETNSNNLKLLDPGKYTISVKAQGDGVVYKDSAYSAEIAYTNTVQLPAPKNLAIAAGQLTWDAVENASGYEVDIDGKVNTVATNSFDVSTLTPGEYTIRVRALGDATVTFNINIPKLGNSNGTTTKIVKK